MSNPNLFKFSRIRTTSVEKVDEHLLKSTSRLEDTINDLRVELTVRIPDMEIITIQAIVNRSLDGYEQEALTELPVLKGVRIGPGMTKIFKGMVNHATADSQLLFMMEEACSAIILTFTKEMAISVPEDQELTADIYREMVKANIRLYNRCAAFAPGSSMVEGITP